MDAGADHDDVEAQLNQWRTEWLAIALTDMEWRARPGSNPRLSLHRIPVIGRDEWEQAAPVRLTVPR